ncbi:MAG: phage baseplate assembly protein V [Gammaproteobacteria bacterium]
MNPVARLVEPLKRRVRLMVSRGVLRLVDDARKVQEAQVGLLRDEVVSGVERFQEYGLTSVPLPGCEGVLVFVGGSRGHGLLVATDDRRYRPTALEPGEVMIYDHLGKFVHLRANGDVHVSAGRVVIDADVVINGDVEVDGNVHATGTIVDDAGNTNHHTH